MIFLKAIDYRIIRGIPADRWSVVAKDADNLSLTAPKMVLTIVDESAFIASGGLIVDQYAIPIAGERGGWSFYDGRIAINSRHPTGLADIVLVYELRELVAVRPKLPGA